MQLGALLDTLPQVLDSTTGWQMLRITPTSVCDWLCFACDKFGIASRRSRAYALISLPARRLPCGRDGCQRLDPELVDELTLPRDEVGGRHRTR